MVTLQPSLLRERIMFSFIPQSKATTLNCGFAVLEYQRFLQLTLETASVGIGVSAMILRPSSRDVEMSVIKARLEPISLMLRLSFLVSTPVMPGMPFSSKSSPRAFVQRKFDGMSL